MCAAFWPTSWRIGLPKWREMLRHLSRLPPREAKFLAHCAWTLAWVRLALWARRFDPVRARIAGRRAAGSPDPAELRRIAWGIGAASRLVPGATCLTQALAGQYLLALRGKASTVRLSLDQREPAGFHAHAWLIAGDVLVLGGSSADYAGHAPLADYGAGGETAR